jgi:hypothetical protein
MKLEAPRLSETTVTTDETTQCYNPEDQNSSVFTAKEVKTVTLPLYVTKHKAMKMYGRMEV